MDGNIGIGGDPAALLERMRTLLLPTHGELVIETELEDISQTYQVRFNDSGPEFSWSRIGAEALLARAEPLGYHERETWISRGRRFVALTHPGWPRTVETRITAE
jgi:hypothetical protein